MIGKWDVAVLPKCPDPVRGDSRATISNGLCYSTGAKGKKLEYARDFLKFAGSEEGQRVQGLSGAAIPACKGLEDTWISAFDQYDYKLDVQNAWICFLMVYRASTMHPDPTGKPRLTTCC